MHKVNAQKRIPTASVEIRLQGLGLLRQQHLICPLEDFLRRV